jgi:hypothetical protein
MDENFKLRPRVIAELQKLRIRNRSNTHIPSYPHLCFTAVSAEDAALLEEINHHLDTLLILKGIKKGGEIGDRQARETGDHQARDGDRRENG